MSFSDLPALNAFLNGLSAVFLVMGFIFIRGKNVPAHRRCMLSAVICSVLFLTSYLTYHLQAGTTYFRNPAWFRPIYKTILFSHILLAVTIVPLIIITLTRAFRARFEQHRKIARWTWPLWMYVSVTGVLVYFLLYKIFPQDQRDTPSRSPRVQQTTQIGESAGARTHDL